VFDEPRPRILAVDDDGATRLTLQSIISGSGWEPVLAASGEEAFFKLTEPNAPRVALIDWLMPGLSGISLCRKLRNEAPTLNLYIIFVTVKDATDDIVRGLESGGDDYMVKPIQPSELRSRVRVGLRTVDMQERLSARIRELETTRAQVEQLQDLLPICSYCRQIRDDENYWQSLEKYLSRKSNIKFTHGFCPKCYEKHVMPQLPKKR
jgi:DNA-binding response OmpR family regulator